MRMTGTVRAAPCWYLLLVASFVGCGDHVFVANGRKSTAGGGEAAAAGAGGAGIENPAELCQSACAMVAGCLADADRCEDDCEAVELGCELLHGKFLQCLLDGANGVCAMASGCVATLWEWLQCEGVEVLDNIGECIWEPSITCSCKGVLHLSDSSQSPPYVAVCMFSGGVSHCTCLKDSIEVGQCSEAVSTSTCKPFEGCCATVFFVPF